jgi:hypothetical protein
VQAAFLDEKRAPDITAIWKRERAKLGDRVWWEMVYVVDHGQVDLKLRYADDVDWDSTYSDAATLIENETFRIAR